MGKYLKAIILILFCASPAFAGTQVFMQMLSESGAASGSGDWQISTTNDDAFATTTGSGACDESTTLSDSVVKIKSRTTGCDAASGYDYRHSGFRFQNVTIPNGATITTSYIELYGTAENDANFVLYGNDVDDADDFSTDGDIYLRTRTTANVSWVTTFTDDDWNQSGSINTIIQEIVDRGSWASGNDLVILAIANTDEDLNCEVDDYSAGGSTAAKLHIEWTP